jgi:hypothetical protein
MLAKMIIALIIHPSLQALFAMFLCHSSHEDVEVIFHPLNLAGPETCSNHLNVTEVT